MARDRDERFATAEEFHQALLEAHRATGRELRPTWKPIVEDSDSTQALPDDDQVTVATPIDQLIKQEPIVDSSTQLGFERDVEEEKATSRHKLIIGLGLGVVILIPLSLFLLGLLIPASGEPGSDGGSNMSAASQPEVDGEAAPALPSPSALALHQRAEDDGGELEEERVTRITLEGVPEAAQITVDGQEVNGPVIEIPQGDGELLLVVRAENYQPWEQRISAASDASVRVELLALPRPRPVEPRVKRRPSERPATRPQVTSFGEMP